MNRKVTKVLGLAMAAAMTVMTGCGSSAPAAVSDEADNSADNAVGSEASVDQGETRKIGVLVADVSGEEALGFRNYYEKYIQNNYNVTFDYTDALASAEDEKAAIEKFASKGYDAVISLSVTELSRLRPAKSMASTMQLHPAYLMKVSMRPTRLMSILSARLDLQTRQSLKPARRWASILRIRA